MMHGFAWWFPDPPGLVIVRLRLMAVDGWLNFIALLGGSCKHPNALVVRRLIDVDASTQAISPSRGLCFLGGLRLLVDILFSSFALCDGRTVPMPP